MTEIKSDRKKPDDLTLARAILQQERLNLVTELNAKEKNISELAEATNLDRATVSYHLDILEQNGIVHSDYEMLREPHSKGKIGRYYSLDRPTFDRALGALKKLPEQMAKKKG